MATESYVGFDIKQEVVFKPHNTCISFFADVFFIFSPLYFWIKRKEAVQFYYIFESCDQFFVSSGTRSAIEYLDL
jgi:hypothetical protein